MKGKNDTYQEKERSDKRTKRIRMELWRGVLLVNERLIGAEKRLNERPSCPKRDRSYPSSN